MLPEGCDQAGGRRRVDLRRDRDDQKPVWRLIGDLVQDLDSAPRESAALASRRPSDHSGEELHREDHVTGSKSGERRFDHGGYRVTAPPRRSRFNPSEGMDETCGSARNLGRPAARPGQTQVNRGPLYGLRVPVGPPAIP